MFSLHLELKRLNNEIEKEQMNQKLRKAIVEKPPNLLEIENKPKKVVSKSERNISGLWQSDKDSSKLGQI